MSGETATGGGMGEHEMEEITEQLDEVRAENERLISDMNDMYHTDISVGVGAEVADWFKDRIRRTLGGHLIGLTDSER